MRTAIAIATLMMLAGCAGSTIEYTSPKLRQIETERIVRLPFEQAWDRYVSELSKSFFVINNISKESRIINVSFSSSKPSAFVDCGVTERTSKHPATGEERFVYLTADSATYNVGQNGTNILWRMSRTTSLEGRANIYIAPVDQKSTLMRVNAKYVWQVKVRGQSNTGANYFDDATIDFTTNSEGRDQEGVVCRSKGVLEKQLLNLI